MLQKRLLKTIVLSMLLLFSVAAWSQNKTVTGKVTDSTGSGLSGISITVKGKGIGTQTTADGMYKIQVPAGSTRLVFSSVGYTSKEVSVDAATSIVLVPTNTTLNDVVVIAYGTRKKSDLTGAVVSISSKDFQKGPIASSEQLLQGKVAGLQVTSGGGSAGGGSRIRIRGGASLNASNDPLIVIDGVPVDGNSLGPDDHKLSANVLNSINPDDIESMSVLKDASATALYGSRASNGVLIITTKKGAKGKPRFNFNTREFFGEKTSELSLLNADQIRSIVNNDATSTGNNTYKKVLGTANTDWQNEIYQTQVGADNNLSASGAIGKLPFRASLGYLKQNGILKTDNFDRLSTSINLNPKFFDDHLAVNISLKYAHTNNRFADQGAIGAAVSFDPTQPVYASNKYGGYFETLQADGKPNDLATRNPLGLLNLRNNKASVDRFIGNVQLDYKLHFFPDLHILANIGLDNASGSGNDMYDSTSATNYKTAGRKQYYKQSKVNALADVSLFYSKDLKGIRSKVDVLVGHSYQDFYTNVYNYAAYSQYKDTLLPNSTPTFATDKPEYRLESYFGRLNFTLNDKYLLTASLRRDASSKFSPSNRIGYFPAVALAWKLREEFFKNSNVLSELKLRLGWGIIGQQDGIAYYGYLPRYSQSTSSAQYQFGSNYYYFLRPSAYDPNLKWETTTTQNAGLDFGFAHGRINGSVDVYQKKTKDLLSTVPVAPGSNFDISLLTNVGNIENKGVEFTLNTTPIKTKIITWDFGFNVTYNSTKITNLLKQPDPSFKGIDVSGISGGTGNTIGKFTVGYAPYTFFVQKQVYDKTTDKPLEGLYEDMNRDGKADNADRYYYKKPAPDFLLGISSSLSYLKWSLGFSAHGSFGNYLYNNVNSNSGTLRNIKNPLNFVGNATTDYLATSFTNNQFLSDYFVQNASFLRMDNINLGYNAGKVFNIKANLRISASVQNVFVITKYKGLDPEVSDDKGIDNNIYPRPRVFSLGASLDF